MTRRRTILTALGAAASAPLIGTPAAGAAAPLPPAGCPVEPFPTSHDRYGSNTELYANRALEEGKHYARRYRRHEASDLDRRLTRTVILAPHGGGIEPGTSELCLAVAGYHPLRLTPYDPAKPNDKHPVLPPGWLHDYWMFEGLLGPGAGNRELHVTATRCDDLAARSLSAGALNALALHGCAAKSIDEDYPPTAYAMLIGGRNAVFRDLLRSKYDELAERYAATFRLHVRNDPAHPLGGDSSWNICNRTLLDAGAQLELSTALRAAMFTDNTGEGRKGSTTPFFHDFVGATRAAIAELEGTQAVR